VKRRFSEAGGEAAGKDACGRQGRRRASEDQGLTSCHCAAASQNPAAGGPSQRGDTVACEPACAVERQRPRQADDLAHALRRAAKYPGGAPARLARLAACGRLCVYALGSSDRLEAPGGPTAA
jgi:hypothetical protein